MKNKIYHISALILATILIAGMNSCTDLDENLYSELHESNFYNNRLEVLQAALRPFTHMQAWLAPTGQNGYYYHAELSADQLAWPQKGRHGYDSGDHFRQHYHTWTSNEGRMRTAWTLMWTGVGYVNSAIADLEEVDNEAIDISDEEMAAILGELYVLRAFHYMKIMELWGNVPIVTTVGEAINPPTQSKAEVFEFIKTELETHVPNLLPYSEELVGRVSQTAGYAMLAELYLNAEYFIGEPMYDECIAACDKIISGEAGGINGTPELAPDLLETFSNANQNAREALFQFAFSRLGGFTFDWAGFFMGYSNMSRALDVGYSGNNAFVVIPSAFDAYQDNDLRKEEWFLFGPQYVYGTDEPILGVEEYNGQPFIYVNSIRQESQGDLTSEGGMDQGEENSGARFHKYKSGRTSDPDYRENHYMIYRLTEIYFNKAEALMRKNNGVATQEAVDLVNASRRRAFTNEDWEEAQYTTSTLTMDELLAERGREFIFEGKRRTDIIRFGKFTTASWWDHEPTNDPNREIYPIPHTQLAANPNLVQNPGYE
ncbi:SusD family [Proteiniphilum saccharofermentans]|uniref:SusD family n=1 Tax=Proteiniphilum saccharofermentans TaxID=1642647 RepID=A0A1R3TBD3_9BACT|nr:RagB/SusD family nutrient uptake outer membrane protein [Proteiniphilum saccharofermentans]SCD21285.1 SusD family [Proteiniphilum saccharofermentans]SFS93756.1 Starch-binding associating with outer membrane [Porphyromonadaceae bacterium NLAE-zl-C104]